MPVLTSTNFYLLESAEKNFKVKTCIFHIKRKLFKKRKNPLIYYFYNKILF